MSFTELENLLIRIKDGDLSESSLARAEVLLAQEERLPQELRQESLRDDPCASAAALLSVLGHDDGLGIDIAAAVAFELNSSLSGVLSNGPMVDAGNRSPDPGEITDSMVRDLEADGLPITDAVLFESGYVDVAQNVMKTIGIAPGVSLQSAISALAGTVDIAQEVMEEVGVAPVPLADAVRAESGTVHIVDDVMAVVRREAVVPLSPLPELKPANGKWIHWSAFAVAAVTLISAVVFPALFGSEVEVEQDVGLQFASASEIVVDDLNYDEEAFVQVIHDTDDQGEQALIIWVDDEAVL